MPIWLSYNSQISVKCNQVQVLTDTLFIQHWRPKITKALAEYS